MFSNTKGIYLNKESSNWRLSQTNQTHLQCVSYYVQMRNNTIKPWVGDGFLMEYLVYLVGILFYKTI